MSSSVFFLRFHPLFSMAGVTAVSALGLFCVITAALDSGEKLPAPPMVKMKRPTPPKPAPIGDRYVCSGCGYEYVPELGDEDGEIAPGTLFEQLPAEWVCPECAETKDQFVKA